MKTGDVVFFKKAKNSAHHKAQEVLFKGHAFGVMLGHVPPFAANPTTALVLAQLGTIGFISFDDIGEFLGPDTVKTLVQKFEEKYSQKPVQQELPLESSQATPEPTGIVDTSGSPLESTPPPVDVI